MTRPSAAERLGNGDAFLSRGDLRELGLERRAVDSIFRVCPNVQFPGYSRTVIRVRDFVAPTEETPIAATKSGPRRGRSRNSLPEAAPADWFHLSKRGFGSTPNPLFPSFPLSQIGCALSSVERSTAAMAVERFEGVTRE